MRAQPWLFKWRQFEAEIIVCAVRWYLRYSLSYRDVQELLAVNTEEEAGYLCPTPRKGLIGIEMPHPLSANHSFITFGWIDLSVRI